MTDEEFQKCSKIDVEGIERIRQSGIAYEEHMAKALEQSIIEAKRKDKESGLLALNEKMNSLLASMSASDTESKTQHKASVHIGHRTLLWTITAAIAAIIGAILTAIALLPSANTAIPKPAKEANTSSQEKSDPKSALPASEASSKAYKPPAARPATESMSPKTP